MHIIEGSRYTFELDEDGMPYTPERLIHWLDAKFDRHGEQEDKAAANMLRYLDPMFERPAPNLASRHELLDKIESLEKRLKHQRKDLSRRDKLARARTGIFGAD